MYGYILPDIDKLQVRDFVFYRAIYCGICKSIGARLGTLARFVTGYDLTFLCIVVANYTSVEFKFDKCRCIASIKKHTVVVDNGLIDKIADLSVILGYYKLLDDINDESGHTNKIAKIMLEKAYKKAKSNSIELDQVVGKYIQNLNKLENANINGLDRVSDCFATLSREIAKLLCGKMDDNMERLCYNIGKYIYLIDALDDVDSDYKKGEYNPFLVGKTIDTKLLDRQKFFELHKTEIEFSLNSTINKIIEYFNNTEFMGSYDLLKNIIHFGLRKKLAQVLNSRYKLKKFQAERDLKYPRQKIREYNKKVKYLQKVAIK